MLTPKRFSRNPNTGEQSKYKIDKKHPLAIEQYLSKILKVSSESLSDKEASRRAKSARGLRGDSFLMPDRAENKKL